VDATTEILPPRYRGAKRIGQGGMGEIYRATDSTLGRAVAVKILAARYSEDDSVRGRFMREALAAARLSSDPSIVTIFDVGEWEERPFIVMEYMGGGTLEGRIRADGAQPPGRAIEWLDQAARALDHAHGEGIVHRDVKPANLLLDREGNVHVADFGIASATGLDSLTMTGTVMGTAGYLAPEQALGERATPASDRYALGVVAYELLTGARPFDSDTPTAEATAHVNVPVPSVSQHADLPRELDAVFQKALAKRPADRFETCADFVAALRQAFDSAAGETRPLAAVTRPVPVARSRSPLWPLLAVGILATLIVGVVLAAALSGGGSSPQRPTTAPTSHSTSAAATPPSSPNGHTLNDQAYSLMQQGNFAAALPLLEQAVQKLQGAGPTDPYEGYANYNLGYTLLQLGHCPEAVTYLQRADALEPGNADVQNALQQAQQCVDSPPGHEGHKGHGEHK